VTNNFVAPQGESPNKSLSNPQPTNYLSRYQGNTRQYKHLETRIFWIWSNPGHVITTSRRLLWCDIHSHCCTTVNRITFHIWEQRILRGTPVSMQLCVNSLFNNISETVTAGSVKLWPQIATPKYEYLPYFKVNETRSKWNQWYYKMSVYNSSLSNDEHPHILIWKANESSYIHWNEV
jgi:hypothetical protein